jgi:quinol monooxygenase YgiN
MERVEIIATSPGIPVAARAEFKQLVRQAIELAAAEPGTLKYDIYFDSDETMCVFHEVYVNSEAMLAHLDNARQVLSSLGPLGGGQEVLILGAPSETLLDALTAVRPHVLRHFSGTRDREA